MYQRNLTLLTDLYELTMMQGYFKEKDANETVIFDAFYQIRQIFRLHRRQFADNRIKLVSHSFHGKRDFGTFNISFEQHTQFFHFRTLLLRFDKVIYQ